MSVQIPKYSDLMWPLVKVLRKLGGSGNWDEIYSELIAQEKFPEEAQSYIENKSSHHTPKLRYNTKWALWYLTKAGVVNKSSQRLFILSQKGEVFKESDVASAVSLVKGLSKKKPQADSSQVSNTDAEEAAAEEWKDTLLEKIQSLSPKMFEKLCYVVLRKSGFSEVDVTGGTGDGGVDGTGILKVNLISFPVIFQCKRYQGSVGSKEVRDLRGAMSGRSEKALLITTGYFTTAAKEEAKRAGAPLIELIDGDGLCELLKNLKIGIEIEMKEHVTVSSDWSFLEGK